MSSLAPKLVALAILTTSAVSSAGDSVWLVCKGTSDRGAKAPVVHEPLVLSLFEHRNSTGDGRALSVTMIFGDHVGRGEQEGDFDTKPTALVVRDIDGKHPTTFTGTGAFGPNMKSFTLTGKLDPDFGAGPKPTMEAFKAKLVCETVRN